MNVKLTVSYDGTAYCGWQLQKNGISVAETLNAAIERVTGEKVRVVGSGRTDAGVHAEGQVACFRTDAAIPPEKFYKAINAFLPPDVRVLKSERVADDFHPVKNAKKKTYEYSAYFSRTELPLKDRYAIKLDDNVNAAAMEKAAKLLVGEHDFKSFCSTGSSVKTTVRTIYSFDVKRENENVKFTVTGNGFLYNMVRIMVGTLFEIGKGKLSEKDLSDMLSGGGRSKGGKTVPAKGLCLKSVIYD